MLLWYKVSLDIGAMKHQITEKVLKAHKTALSTLSHLNTVAQYHFVLCRVHV